MKKMARHKPQNEPGNTRRNPKWPNFESSRGRFSNPAAAIRALPLLVADSLPLMSATYPSLVSRNSCSKGILAGHVSLTLSSEASSSRVSVGNSESIIQVSPFRNRSVINFAQIGRAPLRRVSHRGLFSRSVPIGGWRVLFKFEQFLITDRERFVIGCSTGRTPLGF